MGKGQSDILSTVILIATILALSAVFLVLSVSSLVKTTGYYSLTYVASFMTNVADDIDTFMLNPGAVLTYSIPNTNVGVFNMVNDACQITIQTQGGTEILSQESAALIYGVSPNYYSLPSNYAYVWRGSNEQGMPVTLPSQLSLVVKPSGFTPMGTVTTVVQLGNGAVDGVDYGTYIVMMPRVLILTGPVNYIYIPTFTTLTNTGRTTLIVKILSVSSSSISTQSPLAVTENCIGMRSTATVPSGTTYIILINIGIGMR